jgi:molybdate transport system substrate-binding protein
MSIASSPPWTTLRVALVGILLAFAVSAPASAQEQPAAGLPAAAVTGMPTVAAAASLRYALDAIARRYEKDSGNRILITYGATGTLVHQIEAGAPFQALFAADAKSVKKLAAAGKTEGEPVIFARGELSIAAPKSSSVVVDSDFKGLRAALAAGKVKHVAIANPETAPYGRAAQEALQKAGLWEQVQRLLVTGENIGQATTFVSTGAADVGFIARSLAISKEIAPSVTSAVVPESWHAPIEHGMAVMKGASREAKAFADFVRGPQGQEVLKANGFAVPAS